MTVKIFIMRNWIISLLGLYLVDLPTYSMFWKKANCYYCDEIQFETLR